MVFLPPPHLASASRPSYGDAYSNILAAHRRSPLTSASSVILLVAPDVDALCAAKMLAELLKQDDVMHRTIPVSGVAELESMKDELATYNEVCIPAPTQARLIEPRAATHPHSPQHGCHPRSPFSGLVR